MSTPNPVNEILSFTVPEQFGGFRLDLCLVRFCPERSRSRIQTLIAENHVKVNGAVCSKAKTAVAAGDVIELENIPDELPPQEAEPENSVAPSEEKIVASVPENVSVQPKPQSSEKTETKKENTSAMAICKTFNQIKKLFENFKLSGFTN